MNNELYHHGIKGMKWGIRRFQTKDGGLTAAGRRRYITAAQAQRNATKAANDARKKSIAESRSSNDKGIGSFARANRKALNAKRNAYNESIAKDKAHNRQLRDNKKTEANASKQSLIQKHKNKLIQSYVDKGYSQEAAEIAAKRRMKTELVVGSIAAVSVGIIATKAATRIGQDYCDKTIKSGKTIQNIGGYSGATFKDQPFFAATNRHDKKAYGMLYAHEKRGMIKRAQGTPGAFDYEGIYNNQIKVTKDIKRASVNNARKILYDKMDKDPDFKKQVLDTIKDTQYGREYDSDELIKLFPKQFYDRFNQALATPEFQKAGIHKKFYSELEKKGYNAILDINDTRYSGYKDISKDPTIFFGDNFEKISNKKLDELEISNNVIKYTKGYLAKKQAKKIATIGAASAAVISMNNQKRVEEYLDKHPNSKLSEQEILKRMQ